jgi:hypothetical protein
VDLLQSPVHQHAGLLDRAPWIVDESTLYSLPLLAQASRVVEQSHPLGGLIRRVARQLLRPGLLHPPGGCGGVVVICGSIGRAIMCGGVGRAVEEASVLVNRTLQEIHENVTRGQVSDPTSTEELRVSFQRYREFFHRLLSA